MHSALRESVCFSWWHFGRPPYHVPSPPPEVMGEGEGYVGEGGGGAGGVENKSNRIKPFSFKVCSKIVILV
jgi:hypothetical protein